MGQDCLPMSVYSSCGLSHDLQLSATVWCQIGTKILVIIVAYYYHCFVRLKTLISDDALQLGVSSQLGICFIYVV